MMDSANGGMAREISDEEIYQIEQEKKRRLIAQQQQLMSAQTVPVPNQDQFVAPQQPEKSWLDSFEETLLDLGRSVGLTARTGLNAVAGSPYGLVTDVLAGTLNLALPEKYELPSTRESFNGLGDRIGLPQPTPEEQSLMTVAEMTMGAGIFKKGAMDLANALKPKPMQNISVGREVTQNIAKDIGDFGILPTLVSGTGGGIGFTLAEQAKADPVETMLATMFGSGLVMIPMMAQQQLRVMLSGAKTPEQNAKLQSIIAYWRKVIGNRANIPVSAVTGTKLARGSEQLASQTVGGRNIMAENAENIQTAVGGSVDDLARSLGDADATIAGNAIKHGAETFKSAFYEKASTQYNKVDDLISPNHVVEPVNTMAYINKITTPIVGLEATSESTLIQSPLLKKFADALNTDFANMQTSGGSGFQYQGLKLLRSRVGEAIGNSVFNPDVDVKQLKILYATLSKDIELSLAGNNKALHQLKLGDRFFKVGMDRIDKISNVINAKGGSEFIFKKLVDGNSEGATQLLAVMRSLPVEEQKIVTSAYLRRMGRAKSGNIASDDFAENFSTETYLTNYERLSPRAKRALFFNPEYGKQFESNMQAIINVARDVRKGGKYLSNPSGTGGIVSTTVSLTQGGSALGGLMFAVFAGGGLAPVAVGTGGAVLPPMLSNLTAKTMTDPAFVRWLASGSKLPNTPKATSAWLNQLNAIKDKSPELYEANKMLQEQYKKGFDVQTQPQQWEVDNAEEFTD